ncbi:hypothetical protein EV138_0139 [Kribbella voronezhensis]|uniref:Uncharacterized protein n=1 Tax=Kribbella voronezhensis TaxID=2512212 RepID=A0A4R7T4S2_9ACTN|nr:hypothetical protein EV138_0139 [Kribbella voronezhensis]
MLPGGSTAEAGEVGEVGATVVAGAVVADRQVEV